MNRFGLTVMVAGFAFAAQASILVDDFTDGAISVTTDVANPLVYASDVASVIGGTRFLGQAYAGPGRRSAAAVADGSLNVSTPSGAFTKTALCYGNIGSPFTTGSAPDWFIAPGNVWSLGANSALRFNFDSNEQNLGLKVVLQRGGNYTVYEKQVLGGQFNPFSVDLTSADITLASSTTLNAFETMYVSFDSSVSGDFELGSIQSVPEPASIAILGLGVAALARRRRKA